MTLGSALLGFALVAALLTIIPGLDSALVVRSAVSRSKTHAFVTASGIQTGVLVWGVAAGIGATAILAASQLAYQVITLLGAAYLVFMGITMLVSSFRGGHANAPVQTPTGGALRGFAVGLLTNLLNPKIGVFYLATIPQFMAAGVPPYLMGLMLALVHCALGMVWFSLLIFGGSALSAKLKSSSFARWVDRVTGGILIAFGAKLALDARV